MLIVTTQKIMFQLSSPFSEKAVSRMWQSKIAISNVNSVSTMKSPRP